MNYVESHHRHDSCIAKCISGFIKCIRGIIDCEATCCDETGCVVLAHGQQELTVKTCCKPYRVYISCTPGGVPVCQGDLDTVGVQLLDDGFVIVADIKSNTCEVCWCVICD